MAEISQNIQAGLGTDQTPVDSPPDVLTPVLSKQQTTVQEKANAAKQDLATAQAAVDDTTAQVNALAALSMVDQSVLESLLAEGVQQQLADAADAVAKAVVDRDAFIAVANADRDKALGDAKTLTDANTDLTKQLSDLKILHSDLATMLTDAQGKLDTATASLTTATNALAKVHKDAVDQLAVDAPGVPATVAADVIAYWRKLAADRLGILTTHDNVFAGLQADKTALIATLNTAAQTFADAAAQAAKLSTGA